MINHKWLYQLHHVEYLLESKSDEELDREPNYYKYVCLNVITSNNPKGIF
jgi:hypothetical protein